jgi:hypothetical protein
MNPPNTFANETLFSFYLRLKVDEALNGVNDADEWNHIVNSSVKGLLKIRTMDALPNVSILSL